MRRAQTVAFSGAPGTSGWRLIRAILIRRRMAVAGVIAATLGTYAASVAIPIVTQLIVDGIAGRRATVYLAWLGAAAVAFALIDVALADLRRKLIVALSQHVDRRISIEIMRRILGARIDIEDRDTGVLLNRVEQSERIKHFLIELVPSSMLDIGGALVAGLAVFAYSSWCGFAVMVVIAASFAGARRILRSIHESADRQFRANSAKQGNLAETIGALPTIKTLAIEPARLSQWAIKTGDSIAAYGATESILRRFVRITRLSQYLLTLAVVGIGGVEMMQGRLTVGELLAILMLAGKVANPLLNASDVARQWQEARVAVSELGALLEAPREQAAFLAARPDGQVEGGVTFREVSYRYPRAAVPAIASLTLTLPQQGTVAIIGRNGSGKSTLIRLLQGLLRDFEGEIRIGGIDIRGWPPRKLRSQMAVANQDTVLFAGTIRENVARWNGNTSDAAIEEALRLAGALDLVASRSAGLDARLTENAANLSGGQRQRLAIARAVLGDPKIVLLDEPTAFLDAEAAVDVERRLCLWGRGRLIVLITHHLAAARQADSIVLLDKGSVAGFGRHDELMGSSALYQSLWSDYLRGTGTVGDIGELA
ncbi:MAG: ATP-binding cassette domain-containing protein [Hyphomicrobiaceae bacterium]|nr:MAG: ATP-binding cassette domain-containing protein [Hyphomicrobiaceae bacterium]